jgi:hypothetical protein
VVAKVFGRLPDATWVYPRLVSRTFPVRSEQVSAVGLLGRLNAEKSDVTR